MEGLMEELNTVLREATITPKKKRQTSLFVDQYKKEPEQVTNRTHRKSPGHMLNTGMDREPGRQFNNKHIHSLTPQKRFQR
jgi:hypothetical protein